MSIAQQIESIVSSMTDNNIPPKLVTIVRGYDKAICDIQTDNGILKNIQCSTLATAGNKGLLVYNNGEENKPFVIVFKESKNSDLIDLIYPVGSIYMSVNNTSPSILFGGTWEQIEDTFLLASGTKHNLGDTGGSENAVVVEHNHTQNSHNHGSGDNTYPNFMTTNINIAVGHTKRTLPSAGSNYYYVYSNEYGDISQHSTTDSKQPTINNRGESGVGKNMPPYLTVNVWERTA